jgi:hypothetical protein
MGAVAISQAECLNEAPGQTLRALLEAQNSARTATVRSDCDAQLLIRLEFGERVRIHSVLIEGPPQLAPKHVRLFVNRDSFDFDNAESRPAVQELDFTEKHTKPGEGVPILLRFVKFQEVKVLHVFVENNQGGGDVTEITKLVMIGSSIKHDVLNLPDHEEL